MIQPRFGLWAEPMFRVALFVSVPLALAACQPAKEEAVETSAAPPPLVEIVVLQPTSNTVSVRASGLLAYKRETALAFAAPGVIETMTADVGDVVAAGKTLATLRRTTVGADSSEAEIARTTAERELQRVQTLHEKGFASDAALERAKLALERVRERLTIAAPASGVILQRAAERGQTVNAGAPVFVLGETSSGIVLLASVTAADAARVKAGDTVDVTLRGTERRTGKVARIAARSTDGTGAFDVEVSLGDGAGLRSGEVGEVVIQSTTATEGPATRTFIIPALSLIDARADQGMVYVVDAEGVARRRSVVTGGVSGAGVVVLNGLAEGDRVIANGAAKVRDGDAVRVGGEP
jgi:RND family efflux transporter MFP subunit